MHKTYQEHIAEFHSVIPSLRPTFISPNELFVEKSKGSYGNWVVRLSNTTFAFFWKKQEAEAFCNEAIK